MVTMQGDTFVPVPFRELIDAKTGRFRVRHVDVESEAYQMLAAYMIRLTRADFEDPEQVSALAHAGALDEATLVKRFGDLVAPGHRSL
jgi:6-phosphofructokinase 1